MMSSIKNRINNVTHFIHTLENGTDHNDNGPAAKTNYKYYLIGVSLFCFNLFCLLTLFIYLPEWKELKLMFSCFVVYDVFFGSLFLYRCYGNYLAYRNRAISNANSLTAADKTVDADSKDTDNDVYSVYAYEPLNTCEEPTQPNEDINAVFNDDDTDSCFDLIESSSEIGFPVSNNESSDVITEGSCKFGFQIPNHGISSYSYELITDFCSIEFVDHRETIYRDNNDEMITLIYNGKDLSMVICDDFGYDSFYALPTKVADLVVAARFVLKKHFY